MIEVAYAYNLKSAATGSSDISLLHRFMKWPRTMSRCILLALFVWPLVMLATDVLGIYVERVTDTTDTKDFGMMAANFTMPTVCLYAVEVWFRAFMLREQLLGGFFRALFAFPAWSIWTAFVTFLNFPFGRIDPRFQRGDDRHDGFTRSNASLAKSLTASDFQSAGC